MKQMEGFLPLSHKIDRDRISMTLRTLSDSFVEALNLYGDYTLTLKPDVGGRKPKVKKIRYRSCDWRRNGMESDDYEDELKDSIHLAREKLAKNFLHLEDSICLDAVPREAIFKAASPNIAKRGNSLQSHIIMTNQKTSGLPVSSKNVVPNRAKAA